MRNSISVSFVVVAIAIAVASTFCGGISQAHAAGGFAASGGGIGMVIALLLGLMGAALKPNANSVIKAELADEQLAAKFVFAARQEMWEQSVPTEKDFFEGEVPCVQWTHDAIEAPMSFDGIEAEAFVLPAIVIGKPVMVSVKQAKSIAQQRAIKAELARKDLSSSELFSLGCALIAAKKGLLA